MLQGAGEVFHLRRSATYHGRPCNRQAGGGCEREKKNPDEVYPSAVDRLVLGRS